MDEIVETLEAPSEAPATVDERPLHLVLRSEWPVALCGFVVSDGHDPHRTDTAGRDRCTSCLEIAARRGIRPS